MRRLPVRLELAREAWDLRGSELPAGVVEAITADVDRDLRSLGLLGQASVEAHLVESTVAATGLEVRVGGRLCRAPDRLVLGGQAAPGSRAGAAPAVRALGTDDLPATVSRILQHQPAALLGRAQLDAYREALRRVGIDDGALPDAAWLARVLRGVLDVGVPVGDVGTVAGVLTDAMEHDDRADVVVERLVDRLHPRTVQVRMSPATLRAASLRMDVASTAFTALRTALFRVAGIRFPDVELVADSGSAQDVFAFRLNALDGPPLPLAPDSDPLAQLADSLAESLRFRWHWFVTPSWVQEQVDELGLVFPELVTAVRLRYPVEWLSALVRRMLREQVAVRNLGAVLDDLLDLDCDPGAGDVVRLSPGWTGAPESRPWAGLVAPSVALVFLRQRVFERSWRSSLPPESGLELLPPEGEQLAGQLHPDGEGSATAVGEFRSLLDAVGQSLQTTPWGPGVVVSTVPARTAVRDVVQAALPDVRVLASVELPPGVATRPSRQDPSAPPAT